MINAVIAELRGLSASERLTRINDLLGATSWTAEERGWLLFWRASSLRALGRVPEAVSTIGEALAPIGDLSASLASGLTLLRAVIAADLADYVAAEADLAEVERLGVRDKDRAEYYGVKARVRFHLGYEDAWELFQRAHDAFSAAGAIGDAAAIATQAARRALDTGNLNIANTWIPRIPLDGGRWSGYRDAYQADLDLQCGMLREADSRASAALVNHSADTYAHGRAYFVRGCVVLGSDPSAAATLAERALSCALSPASGLALYEPTLVERIRDLISRCREVS